MNAMKSLWVNEDSWIAEEEIPMRAGLKVIRRTDPDQDLSEEEVFDRDEFIRLYMLKDFELLFLVPKQDREDDFFLADCTVEDADYGAFQTHDFQKRLPAFDRYGYAMKKLMERVKDLAILHSAISSLQGKIETMKRYEALLQREFGEKLERLEKRYNFTIDEDKRLELRDKIREVHRRISEARRIWERYAP